MSWNITHQCRFQSRTGQQYCVNISKQTDTGQNIKQLTGSEHPFVTSEANGDDIFMPIRQQTGYLRVLDNSGGTLIDELLPENNTQKMVTLVNLTTGKTEWIGFLAAEVFTQPWDKETTELEFPLKNALACLSDVTIQTGIGGTNRLAMLVYNAFTSIFGEGDVPFTDIVLMDDFSNVCNELLIRANFEKFFSSETIMNDNTETVIRVGFSYKEAINAMCSTFGITLRQQGTSLIFGRYDDGGDFNINVNVMDWSILAMIANKTDAWPYDSLQPQGTIITRDLLPIADFRGNNNKLSFVPGGKAAIVNFNIGVQKFHVMEMRKADIRDGGVRTATAGVEGEFEYVIDRETHTETLPPIFTIYGHFLTKYSKYENLLYQYVERSNSNTEIFVYRRQGINRTSGNNITICRTITDYGETGNATNIVSESIFNGSTGRGPRLSYMSEDMYTGVAPGRWGKPGEVLTNCLLLIQNVQTPTDSNVPLGNCYYCISDNDQVEMSNCFINVNFSIPVTIFSIVSLLYMVKTNTTKTYTLGGWANAVMQNCNFVKDIKYSMYCRLWIEVYGGGEIFWNGTAWTSEVSHFLLPIKGTGIESNYSTNMDIDEKDGFFVPAPNQKGRLVFEILNYTYTTDDMKIEVKGEGDILSVHAYPFEKILTDLEVDLVYPRSITSTDRSNNIYRKTIIGKGFSEDKEITLELGTINHNIPATSFLRTYGNEAYLTTVGYTASDGSTVAERPEMHLLNRMVEYYKTMRRTMEAKIATGIDLFRNRFSYNGRKYMAIDKKHDWEREEQEVKFIEVT